MAKPARLAKAETVKPAPTAVNAEPKSTDERPAAALAAAPAPADRPKRRGRPPGKSNGKKPKSSRADILFMVETEEGSERYEMRPIKTVTEMFDLMDENRKVVATRTWREL